MVPHMSLLWKLKKYRRFKRQNIKLDAKLFEGQTNEDNNQR